MKICQYSLLEEEVVTEELFQNVGAGNLDVEGL